MCNETKHPEIILGSSPSARSCVVFSEKVSAAPPHCRDEERYAAFQHVLRSWLARVAVQPSYQKLHASWASTGAKWRTPSSCGRAGRRQASWLCPSALTKTAACAAAFPLLRLGVASHKHWEDTCRN